MINKSTQDDINKCIEEYSSKIDAARPSKHSLSNYKIEKPWGYEIWLDLNQFYAYKIIHMNKGFKSSLQSHEYKVEANFIIEGTAEVLLEDDNGELQSHFFKKGDGWIVPVNKKHRVIATTDYTALEVSSPNLNDVIRYNDEFGRGNGKINSEHSK